MPRFSVYCSSGRVNGAYALFEGMPSRKNVISWIAMISGYDQNDVGCGKDEAHAKHLGMCQTYCLVCTLQMAKLPSLANLYSSTPGKSMYKIPSGNAW
uniref:Pentatricopeptide repeat-containing protein n=1 Tax=Oryza punctata TaxID=4537 RepID=A0A0E0JG94_ORYPU